jgi:hypothetical protein
MFPILVFMYVRLAVQEEREVRAEFGAEYERYMAARTPRFFPRSAPRALSAGEPERGSAVRPACLRYPPSRGSNMKHV